MNGISTANAVVIGSCVSPNDLVLFDRNNHKSVYNAALVQSAGIPVYLEKEQNIIRAYSYVLDKAALEVDNWQNNQNPRSS